MSDKRDNLEEQLYLHLREAYEGNIEEFKADVATILAFMTSSMLEDGPAYQRCGTPYGGTLQIGNQIAQQPTCSGPAGHEGPHYDVVLDSDDNAVIERWGDR